MRFNLLFNFLLAWVATPLAAVSIGPIGVLNVANLLIAPDGFFRTASVINGVNPAPAIRGDRVIMRVINALIDQGEILGTTIHWHGIFQAGTNFMDGVHGVTQCPIAPLESFEYNFPVEQTGTYWYHSHIGVQYCDGVRGALVIYDPDDPHKSLYDVDDESTIITLSEWYHTPAVDLLNAPAFADSTLINGLGRYPTGPRSPLTVINVIRGRRYRLRLVSISCDPNFIFSIDGHTLTVIEADGVTLEPQTVDNVQIFAAQRYSLILNANQPINNYWIRALPDTGSRNLAGTFAGGVNSAILRYLGANPFAEPSTQRSPLSNPLVQANLRPSPPIPVPGDRTPNGADQVFNLTFGFNELGNFTINNVTFIPPTVPVLLQILSGAMNAHDLLPKGSVYTIQRGQTIQVNFPSNFPVGPHPFHLHGHNFNVIRDANSDTYNYDNPVVRDTVSLGNVDGGIVSIRFKADNPGPWILHCHIEFHLAAGFAIVFAEAPDQTASVNSPVPADWDALCPVWDNQPDFVKHAGGV
uniref:Laccase3 n=1 Tax=Agaricus brasiliensis TaxID=307931 RepID=V5XUH9_9AGAR|nr:laccase3 [Agaricus brasiliensis]